MQHKLMLAIGGLTALALVALAQNPGVNSDPVHTQGKITPGHIATYVDVSTLKDGGAAATGTGNVTGPNSSVVNHVAGFGDTLGQTLVDLGALTLANLGAGVAPSGTYNFTGATPLVPTASALDATTKAASTAYADAAVGVETTRATTAEALKAPLASPALSGTPTAPTPPAGDSSTKVATTAFVTSTCLWTTFPTTGGTGNTLSGTANRATLWKVWLPAPCTTSAVTYDIGTIDNTANTYDLGLYTAAGVLAVHTGSTAGTTFSGAAIGVKDANWTGSATLAPGMYYIALTSSCTASCATLAGASTNAIARETNTVVTVSAGGTLNTPITPPADASSGGAQIPALIVR